MSNTINNDRQLNLVKIYEAQFKHDFYLQINRHLPMNNA